MNRKLRTIISTAVAVMSLTAFVGCKKTDSGKTGTEGKPETKQEAKGNQEIVFWSVFTGPDGENMNRMIDAYNKSNPKMKVKHRPIAADEMYQKIPTVVNSGKDVPDLTIVHAERLPLFAENGIVLPLDDYIAKNGSIKGENYVAEGWKVGEVGGKRYSVPLDVHSFVTYYNKDLVAKYAPDALADNVITFDEVQKAGEAAAKDTIYSMGITWMRVKFLSWYDQLGGKLSEDGEKPSFNNATGEKVLQTVKDLVVNKYANQDGEDPGQLFRSGKVIFWPEGIWMANSLKEVQNLNWGMTHLVTFDPAKKSNWTSSHQFTMLKNPSMTDEKAAAIMDFINYVGNNSLEWAKAGQNPAHLSILNNEEFKSLPQSFLLKEPDTLKIFNYKYFGYAAEALDKIVWETVFSKMEIKDGLAQAQKETEDKIAASKK